MKIENLLIARFVCGKVSANIETSRRKFGRLIICLADQLSRDLLLLSYRILSDSSNRLLS